METVLQVLLVVTCQVKDQQLVLKYTVHNKTDGDVFLVNVLTKYEDGKGWVPDDQVAYVFCEAENRVEIGKRVPPAPELRLVTPRNYYVTPLPAGAQFEEEITLDLPLKEHRPYDSFIGQLPEPVEIDAHLSFALGYFPASKTLSAEPVTVHDVQTHRLVRHGTAEPSEDAAAAMRESIVRKEIGSKHIPLIRLPDKATN